MGGIKQRGGHEAWRRSRLVGTLVVFAFLCPQGGRTQAAAQPGPAVPALTLRTSIRVEPVADPAAQPQPAATPVPAGPPAGADTASPPSLTSAVLGQPLNIAVDVPTASVTGNTITVTVTEPFGGSTVLALTAKPATANGFTTFVTTSPVSFGGGRGGFTGPGLLYYQHGTINDLVKNNGDGLTFNVTSTAGAASTTVFVYDNWIQQAIAGQKSAVNDIASDLLESKSIVDATLGDTTLDADIRQGLNGMKADIEFRLKTLQELRERWAEARTPYETYSTGRTFLELLTGGAPWEFYQDHIDAMVRDINAVHDLNIQRGWTAGVIGLYATTATLSGGDLLFELAEGKDIWGGEVHRGYVLVKIGAAVILFKAYTGLLGALTDGGFQIYRPTGGGRIMNGSVFGWSAAEFVIQMRTAKILEKIGGFAKLTGERLLALHEKIAARLRGGPAPVVAETGATSAAGRTGAPVAGGSSGGFNPVGSMGGVRPPGGSSGEVPGFGSALNEPGSWQSADTLADAAASSKPSGAASAGSSGSIVIDGISASGSPPVGWNANTSNPVTAIRNAVKEATAIGVQNWRIREIMLQKGGTPAKILADLRSEIDEATAWMDQINRFAWTPNINAQLGAIENFARNRAGMSEARINEILRQQPNDILRGQALMQEALQTMGFRPVSHAEFLRVNGIYVRGSNLAMTADDVAYLTDQLARDPNYFEHLPQSGRLTKSGNVTLLNQGFDSTLNQTSAQDLKHWYERWFADRGIPVARAGGGGGGGIGTAGAIGGGLALGLGLSGSARASEFPNEEPFSGALPDGRYVIRLSDLHSSGMTAIDSADVDDKAQDEAAEKRSILRYDTGAIVVAGGVRPTEGRITARGVADFVLSWLLPGPTHLMDANVRGRSPWRAAFTPQLSTSPQRTSGPASAPKVKVAFVSLGNSTGQAFRMEIVSDGTAPVEIVPDVVVLEAVKGVTVADVEKELAKVPAANRTSVIINGYCLQAARNTPVKNGIYRPAPAAKQAQAALAGRVFRASEALAKAGLLSPDSAAADYLHATRQWALWASERQLNEKTFTAAFLEHSRKAILAAGRAFTPQVESALRQLSPNRWKDITRVLTEAPYWGLRRQVAR